MSLKDARAYYDEFSQTYERDRHLGYHALIDRIETGLALPYAKGRVLEIGCGTGLILRHLATEAKSVGIDLSPGMLAGARARNLAVLRASATALPFRDGAFDMVCSFKALAHVPRIKDATSEAARVLKSGGHALLEFYNRTSLRHLSFLLRRGAISRNTTEKDVFVRYDAVADMMSYLPRSLEPIAIRGIRVLTPAAALFRIPILGRALSVLERMCVDMPVLRRLGGFLVVIARRAQG